MALIVVITNVSQLAPISDYNFEVLVGDGSPRSLTIRKGSIKSHTRADGWKALVQRVLDDEEEHD